MFLFGDQRPAGDRSVQDQRPDDRFQSSDHRGPGRLEVPARSPDPDWPRKETGGPGGRDDVVCQVPLEETV